MQTLDNKAVEIGKRLTITNIKTNIKTQVKKLYALLVVLKKWLFNKLSKFVAWISKPEKLSEIGVLPMSFRACAWAFAPINTAFPSNSSGSIIGFFPFLICRYDFIISEAEYLLCEYIPSSDL